METFSEGSTSLRGLDHPTLCRLLGLTYLYLLWNKPSAKTIWVCRALAVTHTAQVTTKGTVPVLGLHMHRQDWRDHTATDCELRLGEITGLHEINKKWMTGISNYCLNPDRDDVCHCRNRSNKLLSKWSSLMHFPSSFARDRFWACPQCVFADSHPSIATDCIKS